jgi:UPF0716 protein FxsA
MAWIILLVLLAWPAVEIAVFIQVAEQIGWLGAILGVVLSGMLGLTVLRQEGLATANRARDMLNRRELPVRELFDAAGLSLAGILLMLPGYVTDLLALPLLLRPLRHLLYTVLAGRLKVVVTTPPGPAGGIIDGEWREVPPEEDDPRRLR